MTICYRCGIDRECVVVTFSCTGIEILQREFCMECIEKTFPEKEVQ